jgi:hypothetical protein
MAVLRRGDWDQALPAYSDGKGFKPNARRSGLSARNVERFLMVLVLMCLGVPLIVLLRQQVG